MRHIAHNSEEHIEIYVKLCFYVVKSICTVESIGSSINRIKIILMFRPLLLSCLLLITSGSYSQNSNPADTGAYFRSFDSTKIYYEVRGTGDAVVLVHGFIVNGQSWKRTELYKNLLEEGYKVIVLDQRG